VSKKESAVKFLTLASAGQVEDAYARFIAMDFIHHNPYFKGDRASLKAAMSEAHATSPNKLFEVKRTLEDGDFVVTHSRVVRGHPSDPDVAVVHIFRFKGEKVVELWDLGQLLSKDSPNENGPF